MVTQYCPAVPLWSITLHSNTVLSCSAVLYCSIHHRSTTHWKQTLFYLEDKLPIQCDQKICGNIKVTRPSKDIRALKVTITLNGRRPQKFTVE